MPFFSIAVASLCWLDQLFSQPLLASLLATASAGVLAAYYTRRQRSTSGALCCLSALLFGLVHGQWQAQQQLQANLPSHSDSDDFYIVGTVLEKERLPSLKPTWQAGQASEKKYYLRTQIHFKWLTCLHTHMNPFTWCVGVQCWGWASRPHSRLELAPRYDQGAG